MKYTEAQHLNQSLSDKSLKVNNLPGDVYVKILNFKKDLKTYFEKFNEVDQALMKDYNVEADQQGQFVYPEKCKISPEDFIKKLVEARKAIGDWEPIKANFIEQKDFLKWVGNLDLETSGIIAESLLKGAEAEMKVDKKVKNA